MWLSTRLLAFPNSNKHNKVLLLGVVETYQSNKTGTDPRLIGMGVNVYKYIICACIATKMYV